MSANLDRGVFDAEKQASSWHSMFATGEMATAQDLLQHGYDCGALPIRLRKEKLSTPCGLVAKIDAVVASYLAHQDRIVGENGGRYRICEPEEYAQRVRAIVDAGGTPSGVFSLNEGRKVVSTFRLNAGAYLDTHIMLADAFDGSMRTTLGITDIDPVCANTVRLAWLQHGSEWGYVAHTASAAERLPLLDEAIAEAIASGAKVNETYERAMQTVLAPKQARAAFDALFPEAPEGASKSAQTKAKNARKAARKAAVLDINRRGHRPGNLATLWNTATYLIDRDENSNPRKVRGGDVLGSMLFGSRGDRVQEVLAKVEVIMADGSVQAMSVPEATAAGVDSAQLGSGLLQSMLDDLS